MFDFIRNLFRPRATQADLDEALGDVMKMVNRTSVEGINGYAEAWVKPDAEESYDIFLKSMAEIAPDEREITVIDNCKLCLHAFMDHLGNKEADWNQRAEAFFADTFSLAQKTGKGGLYEPLLRDKIGEIYGTIRDNAVAICKAKIRDWEAKGFVGKLTDEQILAAAEDD